MGNQGIFHKQEADALVRAREIFLYAVPILDVRVISVQGEASAVEVDDRVFCALVAHPEDLAVAF